MADRMSLKDSVHLCNLLVAEGLTYDALAAKSGINKERLARWVKNNRAEIRIEDFAPDKNGRPFIPVFRWAQGADAVRGGRRQTSAERMRDVRAKKKAAGVK